MLGGGGGGVPGGHSSVPIDKEVKMVLVDGHDHHHDRHNYQNHHQVKMVAAKGSKTLLTTSSRITGSECPHAQLLQVLKAETQVDIESRYVKKFNLKSKSKIQLRWWQEQTSDWF